MKHTSAEPLDLVMQKANEAFRIYRNCSLSEKAYLLRKIAEALKIAGPQLIIFANEETHLTEARLKSEFSRTIFQLNSYADICERGQWMELRLDYPAFGSLAKKDIRKMMIPLGPVVVFGASNFPFAYSTAGGDTACALAAGCPVIVKAHPAHIKTSIKVAEIISSVVRELNMPPGIFAHVTGENETGEYLVKHPYTKAVGFTGSYSGGKQLFDWGSARKEPIPVFAEMGSVNPVFLFPRKLSTEAESCAEQLAASVTLSTGQFCTNPGIIIGVDGPDLERFMNVLSEAIKKTDPAPMLHPGIYKQYIEGKSAALSQQGVSEIAVSQKEASLYEGTATIATTLADNFLSNPLLHREVFGPYSIIVRCSNMTEMLEVARKLDGQLTATIFSTNEEILQHSELVDTIKNICGRVVFNGVPTGVEVCLSMHHGGPFPATTDSRFTSVGGDGIKRFARPIAYQDWPEELLPQELKKDNPLKLWRTVNGQLIQ